MLMLLVVEINQIILKITVQTKNNQEEREKEMGQLHLPFADEKFTPYKAFRK